MSTRPLAHRDADHRLRHRLGHRPREQRRVAGEAGHVALGHQLAVVDDHHRARLAEQRLRRAPSPRALARAVADVGGRGAVGQSAVGQGTSARLRRKRHQRRREQRPREQRKSATATTAIRASIGRMIIWRSAGANARLIVLCRRWCWPAARSPGACCSCPSWRASAPATPREQTCACMFISRPLARELQDRPRAAGAEADLGASTARRGHRQRLRPAHRDRALREGLRLLAGKLMAVTLALRRRHDRAPRARRRARRCRRAACGTRAPPATARRRSPTRSVVRALARDEDRRTTTRRARYATLAERRAASTASRGPTRPRRSRRGGARAGAAWWCCRPAPARRTSPAWPSTTERRAHAGRRADARPGAPVVRRPARDLRRPGRPHRRRRLRRRSRSPSRPTTRPTCTWSTSARASAWWCSTSAITCRAPPTRWRRALALAPFRLGLTATPERTDGRDAELDELVGPIVYRKDIVELSGDYLAEYDTERVAVELSPTERAEYDAERAHLPRLRRGATASACRARRAGPSSSCARRAATTGRRAMQAYRRQRELAFCGAGQARLRRAPARTATAATARILFTQDNATAYAVSRRFLVPVITHQTKVRERSEILARPRRRHATARSSPRRCSTRASTSPTANVAIVVSGSGLGARARAAARAHPAQAGRQARRALRAGHRRHERGLHQRAAAGARCLPLIWSTRAAAAASCASSPLDARARARARRAGGGRSSTLARGARRAQPRRVRGGVRRRRGRRRASGGSPTGCASWSRIAASSTPTTPIDPEALRRELFLRAPRAARAATERVRSRARSSRRSPASAALDAGRDRARRSTPICAARTRCRRSSRSAPARAGRRLRSRRRRRRCCCARCA